MLQLWLDNPDEIAAFLEREGTSQGRAEPKPGGQGSRPGTKKARTLSQEPLEADYPIKAKLEMGLDILKFLTERIHFAALNSFPLKEEPGCEHLADTIDHHNISLLVSVLRKLAPYPGSKAKGLGDKGVRFPSHQRARLPPDGAAPRARVRIMRFGFIFDDDWTTTRPALTTSTEQVTRPPAVPAPAPAPPETATRPVTRVCEQLAARNVEPLICFLRVVDDMSLCRGLRTRPVISMP